jgi:hypothetical protein
VNSDASNFASVISRCWAKSARRLWHYAITSYANLPPDLSKVDIQWQGDYGLLRRQKQGQGVRYDFIQRLNDGYRYYYGVTEDGLHGPWKELLGQEDE